MKIHRGIVIRFLLLLPLGIFVHATPPEGSEQIYVKKFVIPGYPPMARQARVQGEVSAVLSVDRDGIVANISDVQGPALLVGTTSSLKEWEFVVPDGRKATLKVTFRFSLAGPERPDNVVMKISGTLPNFVEIVTNPTSEKPGPDVVPKKPVKN